MQRRAQRVTGLGTTIFAEMSQLALRTGAVNLGQGFPDTDGPSEVLEQAVQAIRTGHNQYAPGPGVPELRHAVADHQRRHYGIEVDPDREVLVTTGATEGIAAALLGLVDPGDEVVVLEPYYDSYVACIQMAGGVRRPVTLRAPDFRLDTSELRTAVTPRTRLLLINSPHNPTGTVLDERRARRDRRGRGRARPGRGHRRGLRAPDVRRPGAPAAGDVPRHGRADAHDLQRRQDVLGHRLEGRVGLRPARAGRVGDDRQAVPDVHLGCAAAAGGRVRAAGSRSRCSTTPARSSRASGTCSATG